MDDRSMEELGELLSAYLDDEVTPQQRAQVEKLLGEDAEARKLFDGLKRAAGLVREIPRVAAPPSIAEEITSQLERSALLDGMDEEGALTRRQNRPLRSVFAFAATIAIAIGGGLYVSWQLAQPESPQVRYADRSPATDSNEGMRALSEAKDRFEREMTPMAAPQTTRHKGAAPSEEPSGVASESLSASARKSESQEAAPAAPQREIAEAPRADALDNILADLGTSADADDESTDLYSWQAPAPAPEETEEETLLAFGSASVRARESRVAGTALEERDQTIEQAIVATQDLNVLRHHRFDNEPLRLTVAFTDTNGQKAFDNDMQRLLVANSIEPLDRSQIGGTMSMELSRYGLDYDKSEPPERTRVFYRGTTELNYKPESTGEVQYVLRMPAPVVQQVVDLSMERSDAQPELQVGTLTANNETDLNRLANALAAPTQHGADQTPQDEAAADLLSLIETAGLAPPGIFGGQLGPGQPSRRANEKQTEREADQQTAGEGMSQSEATADAAEQDPLLTLLVRLVPSGPASRAETSAGTSVTTNSLAAPPNP